MMAIREGRIPLIPAESETWWYWEQCLFNFCLDCWHCDPSLRPNATKLVGDLQELQDNGNF